ncbi:MAG: lysophospholipid acyltransferase family protein [Calditrichia bacterium]
MKKQTRQKLLLWIVSVAAFPLLMLYRLTLRIHVQNREKVKKLRNRNEKIIFLFWHENMIIPLFVHRGQNIHIMVSRHFDGEIIARILHKFGLQTVRGSSTRGGREAFQEMRRLIKTKQGDVCFTPDGPTGPRRVLKPGVLRLGAATGAPLVPMGVAVSRGRRLNSWDRLLLVKPFARCILCYGEPFYVSDIDDPQKLESELKRVAEITSRLDKEAAACL